MVRRVTCFCSLTPKNNSMDPIADRRRWGNLWDPDPWDPEWRRLHDRPGRYRITIEQGQVDQGMAMKREKVHICVRRLSGGLLEVSLTAQEAKKIELIRDLKQCLAKNDPRISPDKFFKQFTKLLAQRTQNPSESQVLDQSVFASVFVPPQWLRGLLEKPFSIVCIRLMHMGVLIKDFEQVNWEWMEEGRVRSGKLFYFCHAGKTKT